MTTYEIRDMMYRKGHSEVYLFTHGVKGYIVNLQIPGDAEPKVTFMTRDGTKWDCHPDQIAPVNKMLKLLYY